MPFTPSTPFAPATAPTKFVAVFRLIDHAAVFALISGTYSPFLLVNLRHTILSIVGIVCVWLLAGAGIALNVAAKPSRALRRARVLLYMVMGWLGTVPFALLHECLRGRAWALLAGGGAAFTLGTLLYLRSTGGGATATVHYLQVWWYLLAMFASTLHYFAVLFFVEPPSPECITAAAARGLTQW